MFIFYTEQLFCFHFNMTLLVILEDMKLGNLLRKMMILQVSFLLPNQI
jgi:hypothetical protein